jgi:hypothetical protein
MVAIEIKIGQKNTHNAEVYKVLGSDDEFEWMVDNFSHLEPITLNVPAKKITFYETVIRHLQAKYKL